MSSLQNGYTVLKPTTLKILLTRLASKKANGYYRKGSFATDIIWQGRRFVFPDIKKSAHKNVWIFNSVVYDVRNYTSENNVKEKKQLPVNHWNAKNNNYRGKITATDLDHAYWRVAFLEGYISKRLYLKGLKLNDKSLRLASLANLSSVKEFQIIENGVITDKTAKMKYDPILNKIYNNIRYTCYQYMMECARLLGDDFICYKTDCIYYKDSQSNRMMVQDYLTSVGMLWKQLVEFEKPSKDEKE